MTKKEKMIKGYMENTKNDLIEKYGVIKPSWEITLKLLEDNLILYEQCMDSIKKNGIYSDVRGVKNPLLSTVKDIAASIYKITTNLGITPWAESKIKMVEGDNTDDFLDSLTEDGD